jgi:hypothetical protein
MLDFHILFFNPNNDFTSKFPRLYSKNVSDNKTHPNFYSYDTTVHLRAYYHILLITN